MRNKQTRLLDVLTAVRIHEQRGVKPATAAGAARYARISPQYARKLLNELWDAGVVVRATASHRPGVIKYLWVTARFAQAKHLTKFHPKG